MTKKPKLFCWSDSPNVCTGFGVVANNLLRDMHKDFEVYILGINYHGLRKYDTSKYFIYNVDRNDPLGVRRASAVLEDVNPDLIFLFQDIFHQDLIFPVIKKQCPNVKTVCYTPVDGHPFNHFWERPLKESDRFFTYTEFGKETILEKFPQYKDKVEILYHGIDTEIFRPLEDKIIHIVQRNNGWLNKFVVVNVNRFQPRKMVDLAAWAVCCLYKGYKICDDCGYYYPKNWVKCPICFSKGIRTEVKGRSDVVLYQHMSNVEYSEGPGNANTLLSHMNNVGYSENDMKIGAVQINKKEIYGGGGQVTAEEIAEFYNGAAVNISSALGEGFGLSLAESAACGRTSIAPRNSAIPEVLGDTGYLIRNRAVINIPLDNGHLRPVVDTNKMIEALEDEYQKWLDNDKKPVFNQEAYDRVQKMFLWDDKRETLRQVFLDVLK